ncbi:MAG: hypothetical protein H6562_09185 [Lewinellaceae bacterium]|nr:hypothetical protein [Lewinellaceae bacterium]
MRSGNFQHCFMTAPKPPGYGKGLFIRFILSAMMAFPLCIQLGAQQRLGPTGTSGSSGGTQNRSNVQVEQELEQPDTFGVFVFSAQNPNREVPFSDSLLDDFFHQYDPARKKSVDYLTLGILGSAAHPLIYQPADRQGFDVGFHQFDLYLMPAEDLPFYRLQRAYTNVGYTIGSEQPDGYFTGSFSRNFANGLNFTLEHRRIFQLGRLDQYPNQNTRNTLFATGLWYHSPKGRYDGFFSVAGNTIQQQDNGGLITPPVAEGQFASPSSAVPYLVDGQTRQSYRDWMYTHYLKFGGRRDSTGRSTRAFTLAHRIAWKDNKYKFFDAYTVSDTAFYNRFPSFEADERGARVYMEWQQLENRFELSTFKVAKKQARAQARSQRDLLSVGVVHKYHTLKLEPGRETINNLFLTGKLGFHPNETIQLDVNAQLGLWDNAGDYRLEGDLALGLKKAGVLNLHAVSQLYKPNWIQENYLISGRKIWNNVFKPTLETHLSASYTLPGINLELTGAYNLLNDFIYFDQQGLPRQTGVAVSITQLIARKEFKVGPIHLDNTIALQKASEDVIRLPEIFGKHGLYYAGLWFRVLDVRLGFDARYNTAYYAAYYNPFIGQFQLQDRSQVDFYPNLDGYFAMRVSRFRAFVKYENITALLKKGELYYQTADYPFPDAAVRIGIKWRFLD